MHFLISCEGNWGSRSTGDSVGAAFADSCTSPRTQGYLAAHFPADPADPHIWDDPCLYGTVAALYVVAYHVWPGAESMQALTVRMARLRRERTTGVTLE